MNKADNNANRNDKNNDDLSLENLELELNEEISLDPLPDDDEIIELTDRLDISGGEDSQEAFVMEAEEPLSLETEALVKEEEEIIELVDAIEQQKSGDEEILELTDAFVEEPVETKGAAVEQQSAQDEQILELTDVVIEEPLETDRLSAPEEPEYIVLQEEAAPGEDIELEMPEAGPSISGADEPAQDSGLVFGLPESIIRSPVIDVASTEPADRGVPVMDEPISEEPVLAQMAAAESAGPQPLIGLSEEKVEEIITRVVTDILERKADKILLEVAEAAIQKEIEKIKSLL